MRNERRHHPRRPARWSVGIRTPNGVGLKATSVDVSSGGIQLSMDRSGLLRVCPRGHLTSRADDLLVTLSLQADLETDDVPIEVVARVFHVRRLSQFEYRLGAEFLDFPKESDARRFAILLQRCLKAPAASPRQPEPLDCES